MNVSPGQGARSKPRTNTVALARDWILFFREALSHPRSIGAVLPSSPILGERMAQFADSDGGGWTVELGAGTGVVTQALLTHGVKPNRFLIVERSTALANCLRGRFPDLQILCEDAANLEGLVRKLIPECVPVQIVSSLPLRSLPPDKVQTIIQGIAAVLPRGGRWIQFTYALAHREAPRGFARQNSRLVWQNVPPARVDVYTPV